MNLESDNTLVDNIYDHLDSESKISLESNKEFIKKGYSSVYGEITKKGMKQLFNNINTTNKIFYDLGSGLGKSVLYAVLYNEFKKGVGIELSKERHDIAIEAKKMLSDKYIDKINFINEDITSININVSEADVIYVSNLCFPKKVNKKIISKLDNEMKSGAYVISFLVINSPKMKYINIVRHVKMTWSNNSILYIYQKK